MTEELENISGGDAAIRRIEALANGGLLDHEGLGLPAPAIVLPEGNKIDSFERLLKTPIRQRARFQTTRLGDFLDYIEEEATEKETAVFVDSEGGGARAIIDFGSDTDPLWKEHKADLNLKATPEFRALEEACARPLSQRDITDWLEDWAEIITPVSDSKNISLSRAVSLIRRVDIKASATATHEDGDYKQSRSALEEVEARSGSDALPEVFQVTCRVFPDTQERVITARLSLRTSSDKPAFRLRIIGEEALRRSVAEEIEQAVRSRLEGTARVFVGAIA